MTLNLTDIRQGIKAAVKQGCPDVQVYDVIPDMIVVPCVIIQAPEFLDYHMSFGGQLTRLEQLTLKVAVVAEATSKPAAAKKLDDLINSDSPNSVKATLEQSTLAGVLSGTSRPGGTVHVTRADNFGPVDFNGVAYWSCDLTLEIQG